MYRFYIDLLNRIVSPSPNIVFPYRHARFLFLIFHSVFVDSNTRNKEFSYDRDWSHRLIDSLPVI